MKARRYFYVIRYIVIVFTIQSCHNHGKTLYTINDHASIIQDYSCSCPTLLYENDRNLGATVTPYMDVSRIRGNEKKFEICYTHRAYTCVILVSVGPYEYEEHPAGNLLASEVEFYERFAVKKVNH